MHSWQRDGLAAAGSALAVSAIVTTLRWIQPYPNPTVAALLLLLVVLAVATAARLRTAVAVSLGATLAFNYFLLPPFHTFSIAEPQNWVVLVVFVIVATIASQLSAAARQRAAEAVARRLEVTRLFDLSRDILLISDSTSAVADVARYAARRFELDGLAICLPTPEGWRVHQGGQRELSPAQSVMDDTLARLRGPLEYDARQRAYGGHTQLPDPDGPTTVLVPLRLGTRPIGLLAASASPLELGTLDALGGVVAIAIERSQFLADRQRADTLRQRADLASALLASFSHDLRTPVTSVRVAVANLQDESLSAEERRAQAQLAIGELDRLTRLFQDILDMARIDAAAVRPERQWVTPANLVDAAVAYVGPALSSRELRIHAESPIESQVDPKLTSTALAHVIENAARYSPDTMPIEIRGWADDGAVHLVVRDHGAGLDPSDIEHVFEPFYRSAKSRHATGTGLGLAITRGLLAAEGGRIWCENATDGGAEFTIMVPAPSRVPAAEEL